ncbi:MAG: GNAT family N-acetyltransferase [Acetobacter fabarum]|jgi:GNAT superfamily N-acetyltransferase|uniref:GNAT family N-acetyltransferase n=1 Tax=Acetobacter fabarum TaxID=483199 RepID=UPI00243052B1|nr:GNAT family N-acetyltransferase [Acetobacter fabarum]MCH4025434.1 GNAT family N-acetyltransferase [Acetobacter fabarum]MCH4056264.1 GNAT family N-acetyltransferase [Acetobacter fabarum]MCH4086706.1 GNAT family N-acetyltransferase [Acetobacter fabarum]MCH4128250.1 GNAT family N-acetyltransferase [Acetobacter fabarum]MCH4138580.1 GNAT family N-acetyltransferase [Acetobacter fabarum]
MNTSRADIIWRLMTPDDLAHVTALAGSVHPDYPEDTDIFAERLRLAPTGCLSLMLDGMLAGYLISHPWRGLLSPPLNALLGALPAPADRWYIHDVVIAPAGRGRGYAQMAIARAEEAARTTGLNTLTLTSTRHALQFWARQGFVPDVISAEEQAILASYDPQACLLSRRIG